MDRDRLLLGLRLTLVAPHERGSEQPGRRDASRLRYLIEIADLFEIQHRPAQIRRRSQNSVHDRVDASW
jgi:hypothetical protein